MTVVKSAVHYFFNPQTGHIDSDLSGTWPEDHEVFKRPNRVTVDTFIPAHHTVVDSYGNEQVFDNIVRAGWFFVLKDGVPQFDEHGALMVSPPPHHVEDPDVHTYNFLANIRAGHIDPEEVHRDVLTDVNHRLAKVGKPHIPGTELLPHPKHTAKCRIHHKH